MYISYDNYAYFMENFSFQDYQQLIRFWRILLYILVFMAILQTIQVFTVASFRLRAQSKRRLKRIAKLQRTKLSFLLADIVDQYIDHYGHVSGMDLDLPRKIKRKK